MHKERFRCRKPIISFGARVLGTSAAAYPPRSSKPSARNIFQHSLHTTDVKEAKKRRDVEDLKCTRRFEMAERGSDTTPSARACHPQANSTASQSELTRWVHDYVEQSDRRWQQQVLDEPPASNAEASEMRQNVDGAGGSSRTSMIPRASMDLLATEQKVLESSNWKIDDPNRSNALLGELVRRGLWRPPTPKVVHTRWPNTHEAGRATRLDRK